ncbi:MULTISPECIES: M20 aminoacylase family protein [Rhizobium/Agrobacterium group]|uniref:Hippurate hydrolase n=2 Tax=Rhizobium/Agrobacterium group TaxID=227290 RepID=B9K4W4_ALLAM|nr:M20 aminoacylase family protein [Allorhizobium ampelinum]MUO28594.1 amidohydrolase [Agrobacterium vitis]ACM39912.1 hippurate hydrolase [Allorhizobium ampelinum S4]MCF1448031.1 amidohydrolase [Allorhizobium ampelinum]MCF1493572.1 amidohydrolase [Allorhizobium ampelinum]MUO41495.1 amidohydrolase [Agrobacterium vitis]
MTSSPDPLPSPHVIDRIASYTPELTAIRHDIHQHPEIGFEEVRTSGIVAEKLTSWGIEVHRGYGKTGVVGRLRGKHAGNRSIGLRADMDALPMPEETGLPFASVYPGKFHGCGHDVHTTILLGAARYLAETRDFAGTVTFIFQPAEEGLGGARAMIADGLFKDFPVDEIYGLHNSSYSPPNHLRVSPGAAMAGADFFDITLRGKGAHAAHPDLGRDPIPAVGELIQALQTIVSRNVPPTDPAVLSITRIEGGSAYNVIPETASIAGTVRAFSDEVRQTIRTRITEISNHIAAAHGLTATVDIRDIFSVLTNNDTAVEAVVSVAREVLGDARVSTQPYRTMGSEDFADLLKHAPGAFFTLGHSGTVPAHNPGFIVDDAILPVGATLFSRLVESRLKAA